MEIFIIIGDTESWDWAYSSLDEAKTALHSRGFIVDFNKPGGFNYIRTYAYKGMSYTNYAEIKKVYL